MNAAPAKTPATRPLSRSEALAAVAELMKQAVQDDVFPGAVLLIGQGGEIIFRESFGLKNVPAEEQPEFPMSVHTVFDIASVSGVLVTVTLLMRLVEQGIIRPEERVARYLQSFSVMGKSQVTIGHLLSHTAGLEPWHPFFEELLRANTSQRLGVMTSRGARDYIYNSISRMSLRCPPGQRQIYSDLGMIVLGQLVETCTGLTLDQAAQKFIFRPLGLKSTSYIDLSMIKRRGIHPVTDLIAPTEACGWRKRVLCGEVHDDNAWAMGGIAGHSGIFSTATDLHLFAAEMLRAWRGQSLFLRRETVRSLWSPVPGFETGAWMYGWERPGTDNELGDILPADAAGISGFTGCSLWLCPSSGIDIVLMSNRIHPSRSNKRIRGFRPRLHRAVLEALRELV